MKRLVNGQIVDMTAEEITEFQQAQADAQANEQTDIQAIQDKENLKLSAKTKLMNGEALTEDEANVMVGL